MLSFPGRSVSTTRGFHLDNVSKSNQSSPQGTLLNRIFVVIIYTLAKRSFSMTGLLQDFEARSDLDISAAKPSSDTELARRNDPLLLHSVPET